MRGKIHATRRTWGSRPHHTLCGLDLTEYCVETIKHGRNDKVVLNGKVTCKHCINTARLIGMKLPKTLADQGK